MRKLLLAIVLFMPMVSASLEIVSPQEDSGRVIDLGSVTQAVSTFLGLSDTPATFTGSGGLCVQVNPGETALIFGNCSNATGGGGSGDITSVLGDVWITNGSVTGDVNLAFNETKFLEFGHASGFNRTDTNATTECDPGEYLDGVGECFSINATIDARLVSTTYFPINITIPAGTWDSGNYTDLWVANDDRTLNVSEVGGTPGFVIILNFTDVEDFNSIILREHYTGGAGHHIHIGLFDHDSGTYEEEYGEITDMDNFAFTIVNVLDASDHISGGNVSLRLNHDESGNPSHDFFLDYVVLLDGFSTTSSEETDPFAIHKDGDTPWEGNEDGNGYNSTGWDWIVGKLNWSDVQNVPGFALITDVQTWINGNFTELDNRKLNATDQRYNETQTILDMNASWLSTYNATYDAFEDTNVTTACSGDQVLLGNGSCLTSSGFGGAGEANYDGLFINYTSVTTTGNISNGSLVGYDAADSLCNHDYTGSHMCQASEIINSIRLRGISNFTATFRMSEGAPGFTANANDCIGWRDANGEYLGAIWVGNNQNGGQGSLTSCSASRAIACCS